MIFIFPFIAIWLIGGFAIDIESLEIYIPILEEVDTRVWGGLSLTFIMAIFAMLFCFPIWLKFKGGKGVATYVGILFPIDIYLGLIFVFTWIITFIISKYSSLSSLVGSISIPIYLLQHF